MRERERERELRAEKASNRGKKLQLKNARAKKSIFSSEILKHLNKMLLLAAEQEEKAKSRFNERLSRD